MHAERRSRAAERSRIIGRVHTEWAAEQVGQFTPDPRTPITNTYLRSLGTERTRPGSTG